MHPVISQNLDSLRSLCREHRVQSLSVFGSAVRDDFDPQRSDLDLLIDFAPMSPGDRAEAFFAMLKGLETLLGRRVDLVVAPAMRNPYFRQEVEATEIPLYVAA